MFSTVQEAIEHIRKGGMVVVIDDEDRENEGDLIMAASKVSPEAINFMTKYGRGLICCPLTPSRAKELDLGLMVDDNTCPYKTAFTVSVDAAEVTTTGISANDRSATIERLVDGQFTAKDFVRPGHMFPLIANEGGVLARRGQTEASVDLARLAGLEPAGVICEILSEDGTMARTPELAEYAKKHSLPFISVEQLVQYRQANNI